MEQNGHIMDKGSLPGDPSNTLSDRLHSWQVWPIAGDLHVCSIEFCVIWTLDLFSINTF